MPLGKKDKWMQNGGEGELLVLGLLFLKFAVLFKGRKKKVPEPHLQSIGKYSLMDSPIIFILNKIPPTP